MAEKNELIRMELFSDAIFAIAATLLILEIKVPSVSAGSTSGEIWRKLGDLWPSYLAFILSFGTIIMFSLRTTSSNVAPLLTIAERFLYLHPTVE